jgi:hypothetical protein
MASDCASPKRRTGFSTGAAMAQTASQPAPHEATTRANAHDTDDGYNYYPQ